MFNINGIQIKEGNEYLQYPRTKVTTTIRKEYYEEYKKLMSLIGQEYSKGFDIMIEMLQDEDLLQEFVHRVRNY